MNTKLGTPYYVPPEVLDGKYDKRCDLWSIGVITFILLCGEPPFFGNSTADVFRKIKMCDYEFSQEAWKQISKEARNFIEKLVQPNLKLRMTVEQALEHPWINQKPQEEAGLSEARQRRDERVFKRIKELKSLKRLQQEILLILVSLIDENQF
jgi:calcium-dependent protein kinase